LGFSRQANRKSEEGALTWLRLFGQFSRFDKWNVCQG